MVAISSGLKFAGVIFGIARLGSFRTIPVVIGSSLPLECDFIPREVWTNAQAQGCDDLDHERDITLAIHAAIPDLIRDTNRSNPHKAISMRKRTAVASAAEPGLQVKADPMNSVSRHTGWRRLLHGLARRFEWNSRAKPV
jgi:hypothetical protein